MLKFEDIVDGSLDAVDIAIMTDNTFEEAIRSYENSKIESKNEGGLLDPIIDELDEPILDGTECYNEQSDDAIDPLDAEAEDILMDMDEYPYDDDDDGELIDAIMGE